MQILPKGDRLAATASPYVLAARDRSTSSRCASGPVSGTRSFERISRVPYRMLES